MEAAAEGEAARSKGGSRGTKGAGWWCRSRAGRAARRPAPAQGPAEGRSVGALTGRADVKGPSRCRLQVPAVGVRLDRGTGGRRPTVHPGAGEDPGPRPSGAASHQAGRGRRGQDVFVPRQPRPSAQSRHQGRYPGETGPGRQPEEERPQRGTPRRPRRRVLQGEEHRRAPDQQPPDAGISVARCRPGNGICAACVVSARGVRRGRRPAGRRRR